MQPIITIDYKSRTPIYEQLILKIKSLACLGLLLPDSQLPSVRQLSSELGINPNTVQKAYTALETEGIIYSLPGRGNFISTDMGNVKSQWKETAENLLKDAALNAKEAGVIKDDAVKCINFAYQVEGEK